jgi:hypothetical protein
MVILNSLRFLKEPGQCFLNFFARRTVTDEAIQVFIAALVVAVFKSTYRIILFRFWAEMDS